EALGARIIPGSGLSVKPGKCSPTGSTDGRQSPGWDLRPRFAPQKASRVPPAAILPALSLGPDGSLTVTSPSPRRSLAIVPLIPDKRYYGEAPVKSACGRGGMTGGNAIALNPVIGPYHWDGFSVSHWQPCIYRADSALRLD